MKELGTLAFILAWVFGFFMLIRFFLFVEAFFLKGLTWSGLNKMIGYSSFDGISVQCSFFTVQSNSS